MLMKSTTASVHVPQGTGVRKVDETTDSFAHSISQSSESEKDEHSSEKSYDRKVEGASTGSPSSACV